MAWNQASSLDMMETENNQLADQLANKVSRLKLISMDMKNDIDQDNHYLSGMGTDFSSTAGLLGGSVNRFTKMVASGASNRKMMCRIVTFTIFAFFIVYFFCTKKTT